MGNIPVADIGKTTNNRMKAFYEEDGQPNSMYEEEDLSEYDLEEMENLDLEDDDGVDYE